MDDDKQPPERIYLADEDDSRGTWICQVGNPVWRLESALRGVYDILHSTPDALGWTRTTMALIENAVGEPDTHVSGNQIMDILSRVCDGEITLAKARELMQDLIYAHRP